ncbi:MAG TPA: hypothetical protein VFY10_05950 [Dehalococcoidia bacterium]|nr:hypothetical protein [Dehalococcoidia bacterium]
MYHVILFAIIFTLSLAMWDLVHTMPRTVAMIVPAKVAYFVGVFFLIFGIFFAFVSAYGLHDAGGMIAFFIQAYVGVWFLTIRVQGDEDAIRQMFLLMGVIIVTTLASFYFTDPKIVAMISLIMVTSCFWFTTRFLHTIDRGR